MSIIISLDIGTTKICAAAYCAAGKEVLAVCSADNSANIDGLPQGACEQSPQIIEKSVFEAISSLAQKQGVDFNQVSAIAVTGQMHGVLLVDENCEPASNLIIWRDGRAADIANEIGDKYAKINGCGLRAGYGGASLSMLAKRGELPKSCKALTIADYICAVFSGEVATEPTHAASWGIYDITRSQWNWDLVRELSIDEKILPPICSTSKPLGTILPDIADKLGLSRDVLIYSPVGDNQAAVIGAAEGAKDAAVLNLGTGGQISIPKPNAEYIEGFETRPMPDGSFILVGASLCGGWSYAYLKDFFKAVVQQFATVKLDDRQIYSKMDAMLNADGGNFGLCTKPLFCGTRTNPDIRGSIENITTHNFTPDALVNSFAIAMVAELADMLPQQCYNDFNKVIAGGNAVRRNPIITELIEKRFNKPAAKARLLEEAAAGAAIAACEGSK